MTLAMDRLTTDQIHVLAAGDHELMVRLTRLYDPEPRVIYEGPAVVHVTRSEYGVRGRRLPKGQTEVSGISIRRTGITLHWDAEAPAWADHSVGHDLGSDGVLVTEDYQTELFPRAYVFAGPAQIAIPPVIGLPPALGVLAAFINRHLGTPEGRNDPGMVGVLAAFEQVRDTIASTVKPLGDGLMTEFDRGFREDSGADVLWALRSLLPPEWDTVALRDYASYQAGYERRTALAHPEVGASSSGLMLSFSEWYDRHVRPQDEGSYTSPAYSRVLAALSRLRDLGRDDLVRMVDSMTPNADTEEQMERVATLAETLVKGASA